MMELSQLGCFMWLVSKVLGHLKRIDEGVNGGKR